MENVVLYSTPHLLTWDWRVAVDLFFGGIGAGAFVVAVINSLYYKDKYPLVSKVGAVLSPILVILGVLFLFSKLGQPFRMFKIVTGFNASSPLSWGSLLQFLLILVGILYAFLLLKKSQNRMRFVVGIVGLPLAILTAAYHGWLFSVVTAHPLWSAGPSTAAAVAGALTTGIAAVLLVLCLMPKSMIAKTTESEADVSFFRLPVIRTMWALLMVGLILQIFIFFLWWATLHSGSASAREALNAANGTVGPLFLILTIGLGLAAPVVLQVIDSIRQRTRGTPVNMMLVTLAAIFVLVGGFVFRYALVIGGQLQ